MAALVEEKANSFDGYCLVAKNTFLHIAPVSNTLKCRRSSAPDLEWRTDFSPASSSYGDSDSESGNSSESDWSKIDNVLTVMMKNIPCSCKRGDVIRAIKESGFMELTTFFHLPNRHGKLLGYAFIGFPDPETTENFRNAMTGYRFPNKQSAKVVSILPACIQGCEDNLEFFKNSAVMRARGKPYFRVKPSNFVRARS